MANVDVFNLKREKVGSIDLADEVFAAEVREHLFYEVVKAQLASKRQGTQCAKNRSAVSGSTKKLYKQKGTGQARHGARSAPLFVGGAKAMGPVAHSHEFDLPKKVKALGLRHALSAKAKDGSLLVIDKAALKAAKTKALVGHFSGLGVTNALIIDGAELNGDFASAARNIPNIDVLPIQGINVYDILRREKLVLTKAALDALEARFR